MTCSPSRPAGPLTRELLLECRAALDALATSTINVRLSAIRKLVGEARRLGLVGIEEVANLSDIPVRVQVISTSYSHLAKGERKTAMFQQEEYMSYYLITVVRC